MIFVPETQQRLRLIFQSSDTPRGLVGELHANVSTPITIHHDARVSQLLASSSQPAASVRAGPASCLFWISDSDRITSCPLQSVDDLLPARLLPIRFTFHIQPNHIHSFVILYYSRNPSSILYFFVCSSSLLVIFLIQIFNEITKNYLWSEEFQN